MDVSWDTRFQVLKELTVKITMFWDLTPYSSVDHYENLREDEFLRNEGNDV
jgi:hypothetical protein